MATLFEKLGIKNTHRVTYRHFAAYLSQLPLEATCRDLAILVIAYPGTDMDYRLELSDAATEVGLDKGWIDGLFAVCNVLLRDNPRFMPEMFMDWVLEEI